MKLIACQHDVKTPCGISVPAGARCVYPEPKARGLYLAAPDAVRISSLASWIKPYYGQPLGTSSLLATRGSGFGDALVMSGVLRALKRRNPEARIVFATEPKTAHVFGFGEPDCEASTFFSIVPDVMSFDDFRAFDWHKIVEEIVECDAEPDQTDIWETHLRFFGLRDVPAGERLPVNVVTGRCGAMFDRWAHGAAVRAPFIVYQASASSPIRSQSPAAVRASLAAIRDAFPSHLIVVIGGKRDAALDLPAGCAPLIGQDPRTAFGALANAAAAVCPDSMLSHLAAGMGQASPPVVSLWSSFAPSDRVGTYPNQHPIFWPLPCSPCRRHEVDDPPKGCPLRGGYCAGLDAIPPSAIVNTLRGVL